MEELVVRYRDCSNVCGITGFLKVAKLAEEYSVKVHSHGMRNYMPMCLEHCRIEDMLSFTVFLFISIQLIRCA